VIISKQGNVGIASLLLNLGVIQACGSDKPPPSATGGATAAGGSTGEMDTTTGGGTSSGGAASATGGAGSVTASAVGRACTPASTRIAPPDGIIATFSDLDGGISVVERLVEYPFDGTAPMAIAEAGSLHITQNAQSKATTQYTGVIISFGDCIDASAFTGVQFSISGSFSGCTMKYFTGDVAHQDATSGAPHAVGREGAYQPQTPIASNRLSSTPVVMQMAFDDYVSEGYPSTPLDPAELILVGWQLEIPGSSGTSCVADITLDDVKFY
jgi:hypothetical protein